MFTRAYPRSHATFMVTFVILFLGGCSDRKPLLVQPSPHFVASQPEVNIRLPFPEPKPLRLSSLENVFQVSERIFSGGEPKTDAAFANIAMLGCKTVISVDGAKPNLELAQKHGLKYIHIPIGYDGLSRDAQLSIVNVIRTCEAPFFFHCHHGKHRGPSAVAIGLMAETRCSNDVATKFLELAGTSGDYAGLWRDVAQFACPDGSATLPELTSTVAVDSFVASMSNLDRAFDELKLCRQANWQTPPDHPDLVPQNLATLVREALSEGSRLARHEWPEELIGWLENTAFFAEQLEQGLRQNNRDLMESAFDSLSNGCQQCHKKYRN
jgi:protein tyrosine phosphatase (PTP) superfamily phosphohydrolase (DUF442 family)